MLGVEDGDRLGRAHKCACPHHHRLPRRHRPVPIALSLPVARAAGRPMLTRTFNATGEAMRTDFRMLAVLAAVGRVGVPGECPGAAEPPSAPAAQPSRPQGRGQGIQFRDPADDRTCLPASPSGDVGWDIGGSFRAKPPSWPIGLQLDMIWLDLAASIFQFTLDGVYQFSARRAVRAIRYRWPRTCTTASSASTPGLGADFAI